MLGLILQNMIKHELQMPNKLIYISLLWYIIWFAVGPWWHNWWCWSAGGDHALEADSQWSDSDWTSRQHHYTHIKSRGHLEPTMKSQQDRYNWRCSPESFNLDYEKISTLWLRPCLSKSAMNRFDVVLLDDVKHLRTFNKDTIQHLQNAWQLKYAHIHYHLKYIFREKNPFNQQGPINWSSLFYLSKNPKNNVSWIQAFK